MSLKALFYARFHPERGPSVIHQYPPNSIVVAPYKQNTQHSEVGKEEDQKQEHGASETGNATGLFNFSDVVGYIIPPYEVCNGPLSLCIPAAPRKERKAGTGKVQEELRLVTYPISIPDTKYIRNRFTFNVCFVLAADADGRVWEPLAKKMGLFFRTLELEDGVLDAEEENEGLKWAGEVGYPAREVGVLFGLLEKVFEEVGRWGECCVPVLAGDDGVGGRGQRVFVLNLRREGDEDGGVRDVAMIGTGQAQTAGKRDTVVQGWHVPVLVRELPDPDESWTWDLVLRRIVPLLDGVRHVRRIAREADVEEKLVKLAVQELVKGDRAVLLDIWHFQACYMLTREFASFVRNEAAIEECRLYVAAHAATTDAETSLTAMDILELYAGLKPGLTILAFCQARREVVSKLDTRRFITFGLLRGFIRRQQRYALLLDATSTKETASSRRVSTKTKAEDLDKAWKKAALSSGWATPPASMPESVGAIDLAGEEAEKREKVRGMLDGKHCLDEICVEIGMSEGRLRGYVEKEFGEVIYLLR